MLTQKLLVAVGVAGALLLGATTDASANRWHGPRFDPAPVYRAPLYRAPVYRAPVVYTAPVYTAPVYTAPVVYSPAYAPVYRAPVYAPIYRGGWRHAGPHIHRW